MGGYFYSAQHVTWFWPVELVCRQQHRENRRWLQTSLHAHAQCLGCRTRKTAPDHAIPGPSLALHLYQQPLFDVKQLHSLTHTLVKAVNITDLVLLGLETPWSQIFWPWAWPQDQWPWPWSRKIYFGIHIMESLWQKRIRITAWCIESYDAEIWQTVWPCQVLAAYIKVSA